MYQIQIVRSGEFSKEQIDELISSFAYLYGCSTEEAARAVETVLQHESFLFQNISAKAKAEMIMAEFREKGIQCILIDDSPAENVRSAPKMYASGIDAAIDRMERIDLPSLSRGDLIKVMEKLRNLASANDEKNKRIAVLNKKINEETKKAGRIKYILPWKMWLLAAVFIVAGYQLLALAGEVLGNGLDSLFGIAGAAAGFLVFGRTVLDKYFEENKEMLKTQADEYIERNAGQQIAEKYALTGEMNSPGYQQQISWALSVIDEKLFHYESLNEMLKMLQSGRADSYKEALNKYEEIRKQKEEEDKKLKCPYCGGTNLSPVIESKTSGKSFDAGSACCGTLLLGPIGLLCGTCGEGKQFTTESYWMCGNCGKKFKKN